MTTKTCRTCGADKPLHEFYKRPRSADGYMSMCRECNRVRNHKQWLRRKAGDKVRQYAYNRSAAGRFSMLKNRAKDGHLVVELTLDQYAALVSLDECHYCGGSLPESGAGIDRKDSAVGYTEANCVPCCKVCNQAKGAFWSYDAFVVHIAPGIRRARASVA